MFSYSVTTLALAALTITAKAQIVYNNTQINVNSTNQYSGSSLVGYHVGAGQSYIVARASGSGSSFSFNLSATSDQLLDNDIAAGYQLPCFIDNVPTISANSGPLECGVGGGEGAFRISSTTSPSNPAPGKISFDGISLWYICAVQSFTYGWVQGTIVGSFGNGGPAGPGVQNCTSIDSIAFVDAAGGNSASTTAGTSTSEPTTASTILPTTTSVSGSGSESASSSVTASTTLQTVEPTSISPSQDSASYATTMRTVISPCQGPVPVGDQSTSASAPSSASISSSAPTLSDASTSSSAPTSSDASTSDSASTSSSASTSNDASTSNGASISSSASTSSDASTPSSMSASSDASISDSASISSSASTSSDASTPSTMSTVVTPTISNPIATYTGLTFTPIAPFAGAAATNEVSALIGLVLAVAALLS